ncbi:hypothetical protein DSCW_07670 [Desulfosarcina widdelii]|uniref:Uncharacterized protein n=1 Tax=Desulfosarcina widdelii TaxID=947919 RepID=A0A5K7YYA4_9BACT|nr:hypothetical protein [Desulfosarcina widdelii]BBO73350.1 hypothetical protein DSCW_07670 [Desulfosarcina widdelii]
MGATGNKNPFLVLVENWPSPFVAREKLPDFSGGILNSRYVANLDSQGNGPKGRFYVGRKAAYPTVSVADWMWQRSR